MDSSPGCYEYIMNNKRDVTFSWDIHGACNYRCPYCFHNGKWEEMARDNFYPGTPRIVESLACLRDKYGACILQITGGEPLTYPGFADILNAACAMHRVTVITNLYPGIRELSGLIKKLSSTENLTFQVSFHPTHTDPDSMMEKLELLAGSGIRFLDITMVGWPPLLKDVTRYREVFYARGIKISVSDFWGSYEGRDYPFSYTDAEKKLVSEWKKAPESEILAAPPKTMGELCTAGYSYAMIRPNGDVFRCGGRGFENRESALGNVFTGDPGLFSSPQPCDMTYCRCSQFKVHKL